MGRKFIKFNRFFMSVCASLASLNSELNLPNSRMLIIIDRITMIWSAIIFITTCVKMITFQPYPALQTWLGWSVNNQYYKFTLRDLLSLNYLIRLNEFGKLYCGLVMVAIGSPLIWRVYLNFYRPFKMSQLNKITNGSEAKCKLIRFFLDGPILMTHDNDMTINDNSIASETKHFQAVIGDPKFIGLKWIAAINHIKDSNGQHQIRRNNRALSRLYQHKFSNGGGVGGGIVVEGRGRSLPRTGCESGCDVQFQLENEVYINPIRANDVFADYSQARWLFLVKRVYWLIVVVIIVSTPLFYYTICGLQTVMRIFTIKLSDLDPNDEFSYLIVEVSRIYGTIEQLYACSQAALFFIFTNIFITIFYADLVYKLKPIAHELQKLNYLYQTNQINLAGSTSNQSGEPHFKNKNTNNTNNLLAHVKLETTTTTNTMNSKEIKGNIIYQQMRLWAYFDNVSQLDSFVSKYSVVSMLTFIIGLGFGLSYLRVEDSSLKAGSAAVVMSNFLSFSYLYLISSDIEKRSTRLHNIVLSIVARDSDHATKRIWQKTLFGFYASDGRRTFTLDNRYPLNLHSFFKTMFGVATMSLVINRLFHKRSWESITSPSSIT